MRTFLLIVGILIIIASVLSLLYAVLNWHGYNNVIDGSASLYNNLHRKMIKYFIIGIVLALIGTGFIILYFKI